MNEESIIMEDRLNKQNEDLAEQLEEAEDVLNYILMNTEVTNG